MIVDISNEVLTKLKTVLTDVTVLTEDQDDSSLPKLIITEIDNSTNLESVDSSGEKMNDIAFDINIYTDGNGKISKAKEIRNRCDEIMSGFYRMTRVLSNPMPNYMDTNIYRYVMRYTCVVDEKRMIYRG